jgi:hypothetical protein
MAEARFTVIPFIVPVVVLVVFSGQSFGFTELAAYVFISQVVSLALLKKCAPFKSLYQGNKHYRFLFQLIYLLFVCLPLALLALFPLNALVQLICPISYALGCVISMLFNAKWFSAAKLEPLGWYTNEQVLEGPSGSPVGNKIAVLLGGVIFLGILSLFVRAM